MPHKSDIVRRDYHKEYAKRNRKKFKQYWKKFYANHPGYRSKENASRQRSRYKEHRQLINVYKNVPCIDCHTEFPPYVMDFDHLPGQVKSFGIGASHIMSKEKLIAEIAKCEVVCANCHRIRTWTRKGYHAA